MEIKTVRVIYFSPAGTTKRLAERIANGIAEQSAAYDLLLEPKLPGGAFRMEDVAVVGAPVYSGRIPAVCAERIRHYQGSGTPAIAFVSYGNRAYEDALLELVHLLQENGFVVIGAAAFVAQHAIFPEVAAGRPDAEDLKKADDFSAACANALAAFPEKKPQIQVKGNVPYREPMKVPLYPSADPRCLRCGACIRVCPAQAISPEKPWKTNKERCIACAACLHVCSLHGRRFKGPAYKLARRAFIKKYAERLEPELFL